MGQDVKGFRKKGLCWCVVVNKAIHKAWKDGSLKNIQSEPIYSLNSFSIFLQILLLHKSSSILEMATIILEVSGCVNEFSEREHHFWRTTYFPTNVSCPACGVLWYIFYGVSSTWLDPSAIFLLSLGIFGPIVAVR